MDKLNMKWVKGDSLTADQLNEVASRVNTLDDIKQDLIEDLEDIRSYAQTGASAVDSGATDSFVDSTFISNSFAKSHATTQAEVKTELNKYQPIISDLDTIKSGASLGATAAQPADIADMQTKTAASSKYYKKTDYNTWYTWIGREQSPNISTTEYNAVSIQGYNSTGDLVQLPVDTFSKGIMLDTDAWGVKIDPNSSATPIEAVGNWDLWSAYKENIGRYLLTPGGIALKLSTTDSSKTIDGTTIGKTDGNIMVKIPQFYYRVVNNSDGTYTLWGSEMNIGGNIMKTHWVGAYYASINSWLGSSKLSSWPGVVPSNELSIESAFTNARANGENYGLVDYDIRKAMVMLFLFEFKDRSCSTALGYGVNALGDNWIAGVYDDITGRTSSYGDACGKILLKDLGITCKTTEASEKASHVTLFGIEDPYGWKFELTQGIYSGSSGNASQLGNELYLYDGNKIPDSNELQTIPSTSYATLTMTDDVANTMSESPVQTIKSGDNFDIIPEVVGSTFGTYWDGMIKTDKTKQLVTFGGNYNYSSLGSMVIDSDWPASGDAYGTRLAYYGDPVEVNSYDDSDVSDWYGVRVDVSGNQSVVTRIGKMEYHKTLPIQSKMKGCLLDDSGTVVQYLNESDWTSEARDGSLGQVMIEIPEHYRKFTYEGNTYEVRLSESPLPNYHKVPKMYISAYEAAYDNTNKKLCSVVNTDPQYRGGTGDTRWDADYRSTLGKPRTNISLTNYRAYARNRGTSGLNGCGWNCLTYDAHKVVYWLYVVEYASLNSQADFKSELTTKGYHQGGLGAGVTTLNYLSWFTWLNYNPFIPCGYTDSLGNGTGIVLYEFPYSFDSLPSGRTAYGYSSSTEYPINYYLIINTSKIYRSKQATKGHSYTETDYWEEVDAIYRGEYDSTVTYTVDQFVSSDEKLYTCLQECTGQPVTNTTYWKSVNRTKCNVPRYRGIENPFGHIWKWCDGINIRISPNVENGGDGLSKVFTCSDPSKFSSIGYDGYTYVGDACRTNGFCKDIIGGEYGEIVCDVTGNSNYFWDYYYTNIPSQETLRGVLLGGSAFNSSSAGLSNVNSNDRPSLTAASYGSRLCYHPE